MTEQSSFSKYSKKFLCKILLELAQTDFDFENPYFYDISNQEKILKKILKKYVTDPILSLDCEFFAKLHSENEDLLEQISKTKDYNLAESMVIPQAKTFEIDYYIKETEYVRRDFTMNLESYDEDWVKENFKTSYSDGNLDLWDGRHYDTETYDTEFDDWDISRVNLIEEKKLNENNFIRTKKLISELDKKTLMELRDIIDKRLMKG